MAVREYVRLCKQAGCGQEFIVSAPSIEEDRAIGFSEPEYCPRHRALHARSYSRIACHHYDVALTPAGEELVRIIEQHNALESQETADFKGKDFDPWAMPGEGLGPGGIGRFQRPIRAFVANSAYIPQAMDFQIAEKKDDLLAALEDHQVIVLVGQTGSGKSTYVPWLLLTGGVPGQLSKWAKRGPICVTQPRIQATRQVPRFIANSLNGTSLGVGGQIGFSHSRADEFDRRTRLIFKTDGKLINDIASGAVSNYSIIMIDEAHERSVNIDLILGLLKDQLYLYPHLRLIIASATIDHESFRGFFGGPERVPFIFSKGRRFKITPHWWGDPDPQETWWRTINNGQLPARDQLPKAIAELVGQLSRDLDALPPDRKEAEDGHILVFLPGTREIDKTVSEINAASLNNVVSLPLYAQRPLDEQEAALDPKPDKHPKVYRKRRVVVSTNVAETSLTVEGVKYVIDSGYIKESYWNPTTEVSELQTVRHSQAGCEQRWGRAGRISPGHAYMLYTRKQFDETFPKKSTPEIARASLEQVLLTAKAAGVRTAKGKGPGNVLDLSWMPLPPEDSKRFQEEMSRAYDSLRRQTAIDEDGDLTRFGLELRGMPAALDAAQVFIEGERHAMGIEVATLLPFLKLEYGLQAVLLWDRAWDPYTKLRVRQNHLDLVHGCRDDLELYLKLWMLWESQSDEQRRKWEDDGGVSYKNFLEKIEAERRKLIETTMDWRKAEKRPIAVEKIDALRALIAYCLRDEIYLPVESVQEADASPSARRLREPDVLAWDSYWEGSEQYEEYDDELNFDPTCSAATGGRSGIYRRYDRRTGESDESALIELAPTSVCAGRADAELLVACQRRANFRWPARAKVLGMNMIRVEREWLTTFQGSVLARALLYASLSRRRDPADHRRLNERLFLPWLLKRGTRVRGAVRSWDPGTGACLDLTVTISANFNLAGLGGQRLSVKGWLPAAELPNVGQAQVEKGVEVSAEVVGYTQEEAGDSLVILGRRRGASQEFQAFIRGYRKGTSIIVEMCQVLEDPLGRSPMFIVREPVSGLEVPMADIDFCGNTHPQAYYGRRFDIGESFEVEVRDIDLESGQVYLSRGRQLLGEYSQVLGKDFHLITVTVKRVDRLGAYFALPGSDYVAFVRRALWPVGINLKPNDHVEARLRHLDRQVNVAKMEERLKDREPLPEELNLSIELDLRIPPAYHRFCDRYQIGDRIKVMAEKPLENGSLLVGVDDVLKSTIYESELGLNDKGRLKSARDYPPGESLVALIYQMVAESATVRCSFFRVLPLPLDIQRDHFVDARVLTIHEDTRDKEQLWLTCSLQNQYQVRVKTAAGALDPPLEVGEMIQVCVDKVNRVTNVIFASLQGRSENLGHESVSASKA